ncbi:unnamed protein product, partial [Coccothraustes coccothraustes]
YRCNGSSYEDVDQEGLKRELVSLDYPNVGFLGIGELGLQTLQHCERFVFDQELVLQNTLLDFSVLHWYLVHFDYEK